MRRHKFKAVADDDTLPVMVPRNDKAAVPIPRERVRRLRKHLIVTLRELRMTQDPELSVSPPEPEGFAARVARTACSLCKGWCCTNGADHAFLDQGLTGHLAHHLRAHVFELSSGPLRLHRQHRFQP